MGECYGVQPDGWNNNNRVVWHHTSMTKWGRSCCSPEQMQPIRYVYVAERRWGRVLEVGMCYIVDSMLLRETKLWEWFTEETYNLCCQFSHWVTWGNLAGKVKDGDSMTTDLCDHYKCEIVSSTQIMVIWLWGSCIGALGIGCKYHSFSIVTTLNGCWIKGC